MNARALATALFTIVVWASLALLADRMKLVPSLLSSGFALMVGGLVGAWQPGAWRAPLGTYVLGVGGLFGYHALVFAAFGLAPAVEVNLLQYLWPLLISHPELHLGNMMTAIGVVFVGHAVDWTS